MLDEFVYDLEGDGLSPRTVSEYRRLLSKLPFELPGTASQAKSYLAERRRAGVSAATIHYETRALRSFGRWYRDTYGEANPYTTLKLPRVPQPVPGRVATPEAVDELLRSMRREKGADRILGSRNIALIRVMQTTGARLSEVAAMNISDVDFAARRIAIHETKNYQGRFAPLADVTAASIRHWMNFREGWPALEDDALWVGHDGRRLAGNGIAQMLKRVNARYGIDPPLTAHTFRRGLAHTWAAAGGLDDALMSIAGWRSAAMPARYRAELVGTRAHDEFDRIMNPGFRTISRRR